MADASEAGAEEENEGHSTGASMPAGIRAPTTASLAYMICSAVRICDKACCLARFPSNDRRIFAREGRFGLELFKPLILLLVAEESPSEGTPK
jgi:hypothetical protein